MRIVALLEPAIDFIVNKISDPNTSARNMIIGLIAISIISNIASLWKYLRYSYRHWRGRDRIDVLKIRAQALRENITELQASLRDSASNLDSEFDIAIGSVERLKVVPTQREMNRQRQAISRVSTLKKKNNNQQSHIQDILHEMLANSAEAERWFTTRGIKISERADRHSPTNKKGK